MLIKHGSRRRILPRGKFWFRTKQSLYYNLWSWLHQSCCIMNLFTNVKTGLLFFMISRKFVADFFAKFVSQVHWAKRKLSCVCMLIYKIFCNTILGNYVIEHQLKCYSVWWNWIFSIDLITTYPHLIDPARPTTLR